MSDEKLQTLLGKEKKEISLPSGDKIRILPLNLMDISDLEEMFGPIENAFDQISIKKLIYLTWLSVRKNGLIDAEIYAEQWKYLHRQVGSWFDFGNMKELIEIMDIILMLSGFKAKKKKTESKNAQGPQEEKKSPAEESGQSLGANTSTTSQPNSKEAPEKSA